MTKPDHEYGLLIERVNRHGTDYVEVTLARREADRDYPLGCPTDGETLFGYGCPKHLVGFALDGLGMYGFISESKPVSLIAHNVEFRNVHASDEAKLARMLKTLKRVNARIKKDQAWEPGDKFMALAKALKLTFAVERIGERGRPLGPQNSFRWISIADGRERYRTLIADAVAEAEARQVA